MKTYHVNRSFFHKGQIQRKGSSVELTDNQARYLLITGMIEMADDGLQEITPTEPGPKPKETHAPVKKRAVEKHPTKSE